jgi:hypothetical protein
VRSSTPVNQSARRLPLRGADLVLTAMHAPWRTAGLSNNTLMVVECDSPIVLEDIRRSLERFLALCPWPAARLRRPFPWGKLHWAAGPRAALGGLPIGHRAVAIGEELSRVLESELNAAIDPRREPPLRVLAIDRGPEAGARGVLVLTWFHPFMDPRGAQGLLALLARLGEHGGRPPSSGVLPSLTSPPDSRSLAERGRLARRSLDYMRTLAPIPPVSPGTGRTASGRHRFRQLSFVEGDAAGPGRATREIAWRLAIVGRAIAELWRRRGLPDVPFLLPISVDLRPAGDLGPIFGNQLAFHFARFRPSETADVPALARALRAQMADALRDGQIEANRVAMEFLQYRPLSTMLRALPWTARGETFSFNCADIGDFPPLLDRLFGLRVTNVYHIPAVLPRPGIGVFFNRCAGRHNLVVSWVEGSVDEDEAARVVEVVREGMGWVSAP